MKATDKSCVSYLRVQIVTFSPLSLLVFVEANPVIKVNALISINVFLSHTCPLQINVLK